MSKTLNFKVVGERTLHCNGCANSVVFALSKLEGVEKVEADWKEQSIQIDLSSDGIELETIVNELDWIGYEVEVA